LGGWVETSWTKGQLVADVVAFPRYRPRSDEDEADSEVRAVFDPEARRLLRVSTPCEKRPVVSSRVVVVECEPGASDEDVRAAEGGIVFFSAVPLHALTLDADPTTVITTALSRLEGIEEAYISGSWAAGRVGTRSTRQEIDIAVVGTIAQNDLHRAAAEAGNILGCDVKPTLAQVDTNPDRSTAKTGDIDQDVMLATVWSRPLLKLQLD